MRRRDGMRRRGEMQRRMKKGCIKEGQIYEKRMKKEKEKDN